MLNHYYTKIILRMTDDPFVYIPVSKTKVDYFGEWELCGGGHSDPVQVAQEQSQANFDNTLQNIFQQQYATQKSQLDYLKTQLQPILANNQGYTPAQLAAQRTSATDTNSAQYQAAQAALNNQVLQNSGGSKLTGVAGATTEADAALLDQEAKVQASSQNQITTNNANLQQSNYWNAINALNGVAAQQNPLGYSSAAEGAAGASAGAANANVNYINATQSPVLGALGGLAGGALGAAGSAGGFGKLFCWVAASFWGWDSLKTWVVRLWVATEAPSWFRKSYIAYGERIAKTPVRWIFRPLFAAVLAGAR